MSKLNLFQKKHPLRLENFVCDLESMLTGVLDVQNGTLQWFVFFFLDFDKIIKFGKHELGTKKKKKKKRPYKDNKSNYMILDKKR